MNYKKTWFGWVNFIVGTLFMGVFLFASLVSLFEFSGLTVSLFNVAWFRVSFVASIAVIAGIVGIVILWHYIKKKIPFSDSSFSNGFSNSITSFLFVAILSAGVFLRINTVPNIITHDSASLKYINLINEVFNSGSIENSDAITYAYAYIGAFLNRVFGTGSYAIYYFNIFLQMFAFVFLFFAIKITFGKTVALFSFMGMFLTTLPIGYITKITPDSLILFVISVLILTLTLLINDWASGVMKNNSNFILFALFSLILGFLTYLNPVFFVISVYFSIKSQLIVLESDSGVLVNKRTVPSLFFEVGSIIVAVLIIILTGFLNNDVAGAFAEYASKVGISSYIRFFIYPSEYLITSIILFAFAFIGYIYFVFSDKDYISYMTVLFACLYAIFAKNMIAYDLSVYFVIMFALFMGLGVKRMFFEGYGIDVNDSLDDEDEEDSSTVSYAALMEGDFSSEEDEKNVESVSESDSEFVSETNVESDPEVNPEELIENSGSSVVKEVSNDEPQDIESTETDNSHEPEEELQPADTSSLAEEDTGLEPVDIPVKIENIKFIDNILPMPKPHRKKNLDYAFEPSENEMKYDYDVDENDDFDLL